LQWILRGVANPTGTRRAPRLPTIHNPYNYDEEEFSNDDVEEDSVKFRCERDTLAEAIATAQRTVASRTGALPVLQDLRVTATDDGLELIGSDLEITNRVRVPADVEESGVAVVPKLLGEIVRRLEPGPVTVAVTGDEAVITAGRFSTSLRLKPAEDYPRLAPPDGAGVRVDAASFAAALKQVVRAASRDDLRPILTGVLLTAQGNGVRLVATDSYRLAVRDLAGVSMLPEGQRVLVAAKGLAEVQRLAGDGEIEVVLRERDVVFRTSRAEVTARLIEGDFPNYEQLIPSGYPNRLTVSRETLLDALDRVQIVGQNRDNAAVRLAMSADGLELSMSAQDVGNAQETLDAKFEGGELTAAFNPVFLREGVEAVDVAEVALETIDPLKPATLRAADGGDFLYLLMPVRTS
jgi:DNA polymerase-3 subunit beta